MSFKKYIKAVGTGPKGNRDLEESEVIDAIELILENKVTQAQIGAFLIAWRTKLETDSELIAAVKALKKYIVIDHTNNRYTFVNKVSEIEAWLATFSIALSSLTVDANGVTTTLKMINVTTGLNVPIVKKTNNTSLCIQ